MTTPTIDTTVQAHLDAVGRLYAAYGKADIDAVLAELADDVDWAAEADGNNVPWYGPSRGKNEVPRFFEAIGSNVDVTEFDIIGMTANDTDVVTTVHWTYTTQAIALAAEMRHSAADAHEAQQALKQSMSELFDRVHLLALPTVPVFPPKVNDVNPETSFPICIEITKHVAPFNVAGTPATAQPVPVSGHELPASLQLVAPSFGQELLVATAAHIEAAVRATT